MKAVVALKVGVELSTVKRERPGKGAKEHYERQDCRRKRTHESLSQTWPPLGEPRSLEVLPEREKEKGAPRDMG